MLLMVSEWTHANYHVIVVSVGCVCAAYNELKSCACEPSLTIDQDVEGEGREFVSTHIGSVMAEFLGLYVGSINLNKNLGYTFWGRTQVVIKASCELGNIGSFNYLMSGCLTENVAGMRKRTF